MTYRNGKHDANRSRAIRVCLGWCLLIVALLGNGTIALMAQPYSSQNAQDLLTYSDGGPCNPQHGADNSFYNTGCCGSGGNRECSGVIHFGKGPWGDSPGCVDPGSNILRWNSYYSNLVCQLPGAQPEATDLLPTDHPLGSPRDFQFIVTSDLHYYRLWYNVADQVNHVQRINDEQILGAASGHPYTAVIVPGDITTSGDEQRLAAYRLMWEKGTLQGASIGLPVYFGLGNHDISAQGGGFGTDSTAGQQTWDYLDARMSGLNMDTSPNGCLPFVDPGCVGLGSLAGSHNYSWDWEGVHMVMLNTWAGDTDRAYTPPDGMNGMAWLARDLQYYVGTSGKPVIMFQHYRLADAGGQEWSDSNLAAFQQLIARYNVVGLFSGHSHDLSFSSLDGYVNQPAQGNVTGPGTRLDNFVDGAGGDCYHHGDGQYLCAHAIANYLTVHVTDKYMDVTAKSWQDSTPTWVDPTIGFRYNAVGNQLSGTCRKRMAPSWVDRTSAFSVSVNNTTNQITVTNQSGVEVSGSVALQVADSSGAGLLNWDFMDSCDRTSGKPYLAVTETGMPSGASAKISFVSNAPLSSGVIKVFQLNDQLLTDNSNPVIRNLTATVDISALSGDPVPFNYSVDPYIGGDQTQWLHVFTAGLSTPATFHLVADNLPSYAHTFASFTVTPDDPSIAPLTTLVTLAPTAFNVTSNVPNTKMNLYAATVSLPYSIVVYPGNAENLNVPTPQYPSAGIRYAFGSWSDGGAQQHYVTVPLSGLSLGLNFNVGYMVTPAIVPANGGSVSPRPDSGGYLPAGNTHFKAVPNPNYYFVGYSGGLSGASADTDIDLEYPLAYTATFAADPSVTVTSNISAAQGSKVTLSGVTLSAPMTRQYAPGAAFSIIAPASFTSSTNPGIQYIFQQWSDGVTAAARTLSIDTVNLAFTAQYKTQYLITAAASPADAGSVTGGGWYDSGAVVTVRASPAAGFQFSAISGDLMGSTNPLTFTASNPERLVANFAPTGTPQIYASEAGTPSDVFSVTGVTHTVPFSLTDAGSAGAIGARIDSITNIQVVSGSGTVTPLMTGPASVGDLVAGSSANTAVAFNWPATATRVRLTVNFSANGGAYKSSTILNLFY
jgi:hypothetical protein